MRSGKWFVAASLTVAASAVAVGFTAPAQDEGETAKSREIEENELRAEALRTLPKGWSAKQMGRSFAIHQDSATRAKQYAEHVDAVFRWLEDTFPDVGPDRYVRGPILRVCKDYDDLDSLKLWAERNRWAGSSLEILVCRGNWGKSSSQIDVVSRRAKYIWFREKDPALYAVLPQWLSSGLNDLLCDARTKGGKLVYKDDDDDRTALKTAARRDELLSVRDLITANRSRFKSAKAAYEQSGMLVELLAKGKASPRKRTKGLLQRYVTHLRVAAEEAEDGPDRAERVQMEAFERTFGAWSDRDWKVFEKAFAKSYR